MKRWVLLILILIVAAGVVACQPTPEEEVVIPKDFNAEEVFEAQKIAEIDSYVAPERWKEIIETGINNFSIEVDAEIKIPESGLMPLATIVYKDITTEKAIEIKNALLDGAKIYLGDGLKTRAEIEAEIILEEAKFTDPNSIINVQETEQMKELKRAGVEETIYMLKKQLKTAPEESNRREVTQFEEYEEGIWGFEGAVMNSSEKKTGIRIVKYNNNLRNMILFNNLNANTSVNLRRNIIWSNVLLDDQKNYEDLKGIKMPIDEAINIADKKVLEIAGEKFDISEIGSIKIKSLYDDFYSFPQCYLFRYTRKVNDAQVTYDNIVQTSGEYTEPRMYESISVVVDDSGIIAFEWLAPSEVKEILSESVKLLDFTEIQKIFRKQISIEGVFQEDYNHKSKKIIVDEIKLGLMSIAQENNPNEFALIPVWDFYGCTELLYSSQEESQLPLNEDNTFAYRNYQYSYLTINAIDGSIIDRSLGY